MAKTPRPPKPKLPKPKKSLGQHIKDNTRKAAASGLKKNFGILGAAVAKKYLSPPRVKTNIRAAPTTGDKKINKKKLNVAAPADDSVLESAKQVSNVIEIVSGNVTRGFVKSARQVDIMGEEVSKSLNELSNVLDRLLYKSEAKSAPASQDNNIPRNKTDDVNDPNILPSPRYKPKSKVRAKSKIPGFGKFGRLLGRGIAGLGVALEGYESYQEYQQNGELGRAASGFGGAVGGMAAGAAIGSIIPGLGTLAGGLIGATAGAFMGREAGHGLYDMATKSSDGKVTIGENTVIHKMKYSAQKIRFIAHGKIEFKSKVTSSSQTSISPSGPTINPSPSGGGFINNLLDKLRGGQGGDGSINSLGDSMIGGRGGAGFFNGLADKLIGGRGGGGYAGGGGGTQSTPSGSKNSTQPQSTSTPSGSAIATPDSDYSGAGKGQYDSTKAKANFMQPSQFGSPGTNLVPVTTEGGHKFTIHKESAEAFKRTIESLEKAGAPIGSIGGYSPRPGGISGSGKMSQHSMGNAMDIGSQTDRDVIRKDTRQWIESHPKEWRKILDENGMISGGDWKNPDLGHIEWSGRKPWMENSNQQSVAAPPTTALKDASPESQTLDKPAIQETPKTSSESLSPPEEVSPTNRLIVRPPPQPNQPKDKISYMEDTQKNISSLDHRPRQEAVQQQDFSEYTGTTSGMEDVA